MRRTRSHRMSRIFDLQSSGFHHSMIQRTTRPPAASSSSPRPWGDVRPLLAGQGRGPVWGAAAIIYGGSSRSRFFIAFDFLGMVGAASDVQPEVEAVTEVVSENKEYDLTNLDKGDDDSVPSPTTSTASRASRFPARSIRPPPSASSTRPETAPIGVPPPAGFGGKYQRPRWPTPPWTAPARASARSAAWAASSPPAAFARPRSSLRRGVKMLPGGRQQRGLRGGRRRGASASWPCTRPPDGHWGLQRLQPLRPHRAAPGRQDRPRQLPADDDPEERHRRHRFRPAAVPRRRQHQQALGEGSSRSTTVRASNALHRQPAWPAGNQGARRTAATTAATCTATAWRPSPCARPTA